MRGLRRKFCRCVEYAEPEVCTCHHHTPPFRSTAMLLPSVPRGVGCTSTEEQVYTGRSTSIITNTRRKRKHTSTHTHTRAPTPALDIDSGYVSFLNNKSKALEVSPSTRNRFSFQGFLRPFYKSTSLCFPSRATQRLHTSLRGATTWARAWRRIWRRPAYT